MTWEIREGDCLDVLRTLDAGSVQTCVTSPPYWGLRDYGTATWEGGDSECSHRVGGQVEDNKAVGAITTGQRPGVDSSRCLDCGAKRIDSQLGLEPTPEEYVANLVEVFREVRRVLRDDGTVWLNLGDSYAAGGRGGHGGLADVPRWGKAVGPQGEGNEYRPAIPPPGLKPKDLCGIPWRVAFALQADGWWLRSDIIWSKPNPMPESVTDRPTRAHEYLYLLAKGQWKTRVVQFADLPSESFHLLDYLGAENPRLGPIPRFCVRHAATILDRAQGEKGVSLPSFDSEVWQQGSDGSDSDFVRGLPVEHRPAVWAARFLSANASAKQFLEEIDRLRITLPNGGDLLVGGGSSGPLALPPGISSDGEAAITIHDAGQVCEVNFANHTVEFRRPTRCSYFYDADAIREAQDTLDPNHPSYRPIVQPNSQGGLNTGQKFVAREDQWGAKNPPALKRLDPRGRNRRSVWNIATQPYPEAHFATFPPKLVEPCILAGSPPKCCGECGAPWERITERGEEREQRPSWTGEGNAYGVTSGNHKGRTGNWGAERRTLEWKPNCCQHQTSKQTSSPATDVERSGTSRTAPSERTNTSVPSVRPATVLDPFAGAGTTGLVATQHGRDFIGIELNPEYAEMARERIRRWEANPAGSLEGEPDPIPGQIGMLDG